ncbi:MAG TPA: matrixin family metalloprotease, partial [Polyangiales bacterium]|nr:matrixin family metalloprotease [Polyangiales bacterium]
LLAGVLAGLASPAPVHAYTINTTELGKRIRWSTDTVTLQMDPSFESFLDPGQSYASLAMGFEAWKGLPRVPDLVIEPGQPASLGNHAGHPTNGIYLLKDWPYEAAKLAVTIVTYEMDTGRLLDADIVVNGQAKFALLSEPAAPGIDSYDLGSVLTHESGHVLGLGESQEGEDATMWPYARPDNTDKRTLAEDDEDGVTESYASAPPSAANGCGPSTVIGRASGRNGLTLALWLLAAIPMLRMSSRRRRQATAVLTLGVVSLLFGFEQQATEPTAGEKRVAAVEALLLDGTRDDRAKAETLATDADPEVAHRAQFAISRLLARAGKARVDAKSTAGSARLKQLLGSGSQMRVGHAKQSATLDSNGLFFTEYHVATSSGDTVLRVAGGTKDGIGQRVIDAEPPPADDQEVVVVPQADGSQHWAYHQAGVLFGGHLGEGPAVTNAL